MSVFVDRTGTHIYLVHYQIKIVVIKIIFPYGLRNKEPPGQMLRTKDKKKQLEIRKTVWRL